MTKKYDREERELERLEKENRILKSQVRSLSKQLKKLNRGYQKYLIEESLDAKEEIIEKAVKEADKICWSCRIGKLQRVDVGIRYWRQCDNCNYRTKGKPIKKAKASK